jgi:oligoribonuclease
VLEVAAIVTDLDFNELEVYHAVVKQPQEFLDRMDAWNKQHHGASGLTKAVPGGREPNLVEEDLLKMIAGHFVAEPAVIAGNSIAQDRLFINKYFPRLAAKLHYRMLDVTSWKVILTERYGVKYAKQNAHRAVDDIRESIAEMKHYLSFVKAP